MTWQIFTTLFDIAWLLALLALLYLIWRSSERRLKHIQAMEITMFDVAQKNAESVRVTAEAARALATMLQKERAQ